MIERYELFSCGVPFDSLRRRNPELTGAVDGAHGAGVEGEPAER